MREIVLLRNHCSQFLTFQKYSYQYILHELVSPTWANSPRMPSYHIWEWAILVSPQLYALYIIRHWLYIACAKWEFTSRHLLRFKNLVDIAVRRQVNKYDYPHVQPCPCFAYRRTCGDSDVRDRVHDEPIQCYISECINLFFSFHLFHCPVALFFCSFSVTFEGEFETVCGGVIIDPYWVVTSAVCW